MNAIATQSLAFEGQQISALNYQNRIWLTAAEIAKALQYAREDAVSRIYQRNTDEFSSDMTETVKLTVSGKINGLQHKEARIFSLRGAHLIAMFARTPVAKKFRKWVLDILDREVAQNPNQQPSTVEDRHPLNIAVRSLANQRSAQGKPADYASVWRTVNGYLGVEHIEDASKEQVQKGLSYVQTLLEGELLPKEQLPEPSQKLDYSVKRWVKMNPWFSHRQSLMPQGRFQVTPDMVYGMDAKSPTLALVKELSDQGHNLQACQLEVLALRHHLESTRNALYSIQQRCNTSLTGQGFNFAL